MSNTSLRRARTSADAVLQLLRLLQQGDPVRVSEAAAYLGVARPTAHRLLRILCNNGFARQNDDRSYSATDLNAPDRLTDPDTLISIVRPHLEWLVSEVDETAHLLQLDGRMVHIIDSVEATQPLRVGARVGALLPAHLSAAGRLFLAEVPRGALDALYADGPPDPSYPSLDDFHRSLRNTRNYAVSMGLAERGVNAVAMLIRDPAGDSAGAISLSAPSIRLTRGQIPQVAQIVDQCVHRIQASIAGSSRYRPLD